MRINHYTILIGLLCVPSVALSGAWMRSEGEHRYSAYFESSTADSSWDRDGNLSSSSCTSHDNFLGHSYEYGYSYYRTLFAGLGMGQSSCGDESVSGIGDLRLGIRGRSNLYRNGRTWEASLILPTGYDRDRGTRLGYGRVGLDLGLHARDKLSKKSSISYGASLRFWEGPPADQFRPYVEWSRRHNNKWSYNARLSGNFTLGNGEPEPISSTNRILESEFDVIRFQLGGRYHVNENWSVGFGLFQNIWGRNTSKSQGLYLSYSRVWGR